jgi:flagellar basal-body rod protein FlgB
MTESLQMLQGGSRTGSVSKTDNDFAGRALLFRAQRQALLAKNIANSDTPGYKALDVSFEDSLRQANSAAMLGAGALTNTARTHIATSAQAITSTLAFARYVEPVQPRLDGNTVDMDQERGEFSKNAILYQLAVMTLDDESKEFKQASSDPRTAPR